MKLIKGEGMPSDYDLSMWAEKVYNAILRKEARNNRDTTQIAKSIRNNRYKKSKFRKPRKPKLPK